MSAIITLPSGRIKPVKNLGWLLRHASEVDEIIVTKYPGIHAPCDLRAVLDNGTVFEIQFNSSIVCHQWTARRSLKHAKHTRLSYEHTAPES